MSTLNLFTRDGLTGDYRGLSISVEDGLHSIFFLLPKWSMENDTVKEAHEAVSKAVDMTSNQLKTLLTGQRESWSPPPREHSTETAYSNTLSNVTAASVSPNKRRSLTPLGSIRNEQTRSRSNIRRADLFSRKSLTPSDMARPTSGVTTARLISDRSNSQSECLLWEGHPYTVISVPPLKIIQTTSHSRSPASSRSDARTAVAPVSSVVDRSPLVTAKSFPGDLSWSTPTKIPKATPTKTARATTPSVSTAVGQLIPKSRLCTAVVNSSTRTAKAETPQKTAVDLDKQTKSGKVVEKLADGRLKVTMTMDVSAPCGRIGLAGKAPDGMKVKWVTVNGVRIFSGI